MAKKIKKRFEGWIGVYALEETIKKLKVDLTSCEPYETYKHNFRYILVRIEEP
jgi:hypothetical protein